MTQWHLARGTSAGPRPPGEQQPYLIGRKDKGIEGIRNKVTVYKCQAGPATLVRDNITELKEHLTHTIGR